MQQFYLGVKDKSSRSLNKLFAAIILVYLLFSITLVQQKQHTHSFFISCVWRVLISTPISGGMRWTENILSNQYMPWMNDAKNAHKFSSNDDDDGVAAKKWFKINVNSQASKREWVLSES